MDDPVPEVRAVGSADAAANRNLGILVLLGAAFFGWSSYQRFEGHHWRSHAGATLDASMCVTLTFVGMLLLISAVRMHLHVDWSATRWAATTNRTRSRYLPTFYVAAPILTLALVVAIVIGSPALAGALSGPTGFIDLVVIGNLTGGIQPL